MMTKRSWDSDVPSVLTGVTAQVNLLIVHDGGAISSHGFLLDDTDELEGAAERGVRVGPFGALKMPHLQNVVVLRDKEDERDHATCLFRLTTHDVRVITRHVRLRGTDTCVASKMKSWMMICSSLERHSLSLLMSVTVKAIQFMASSRLGQ